jgi:hypothetical protein
MGEEEIQDLTVVGQLLARQYHLVRALLVELAQPGTSFVRFHNTLRFHNCLRDSDC